MASGMYNRAKTMAMSGTLDWDTGATTYSVALLSSSYSFDPDSDFLSEVTGSEISGTGYSRMDLSSRTVTQDNANDRAEADAADVTWSGIDAGEIGGVVVYKSASLDTAAELVCFSDTADLDTNGGDVTLVWNTEGVFQII